MDVLTIQWGWIGGYKAKVIPPVPPIPVVPIVVEDRRWLGPSIMLHYEDYDRYYNRQRREEEEIIIL